ncbi:MAG: methionine synthase [Planctomycetes bacterium]|nr:methionine synthase [Planctomycetota bacterium]
MSFLHPHLLPTTVIGSHGLPGWFWTAMEAVRRGEYGPTDEQEAYDDAVRLAIWDQREAGIDTITDGEMRRWYFVQSFYSRMKGLSQRPMLRKTGVYGYDSVPRYWLEGKVDVPEGLGIVEEFRFLRANVGAVEGRSAEGGERRAERGERRAESRKPDTTHDSGLSTQHSSSPPPSTLPPPRPRIKACCPGPLTLTIHIQLRAGDPYKDRMELAQEFAGVVNRELRALEAEGCDEVQIDEPSFSIIPGQVKNWVDLFNRAVEGVQIRKTLHICFGNLGSRPRGRRRYEWMFPALLNANAGALSMEFANREMCEADIYPRFEGKFDLLAGVVDVKSFWLEPPEEVADRIRTLLQTCPAERLAVSPDCGFFQLPRWLCRQKLVNLVRGAALVRRELGQP